MPRLSVLLFLIASCLQAQVLRVFSEFVHFGPDGEPSQPSTPREILSPAVARNSFATYQILVKASPGTSSTLWIGQNPENTFQVTLYRERAGQLTKLSEPVDIEGTEVIWMDVWVKRDLVPARYKLEPELYLNQDWVIYPMEVRVVEATVPEGARSLGVASPMDVMRSNVCGMKPAPPPDAPPPITPASLRYRNALADLALAQAAPKDELRRIVGPCDQVPLENPEAYLRIRDYLLRLR